MNKNLCILPFINLSTRPNGVPKICNEGTHKHMPEFNSLNNTSIEDFWNNKNLKDFRKHLLENKSHPYCEICNHIEKNNGTSKRNSMNKNYLEKYQDIVEYARKNNGEVPVGPVQWEFRLSNKCNLACLTCSPTNSSLIESQHLKNLSQLSKEDKDITVWQSKQENKPNFINQIWNYIKDIDRIELHGGEPFYDHACLDLLEQIVDKLPNNNITLLVHTNMSFINDRIVRILNNFKEVNFQISIDGLKDENTFIRWPSKWKTIEKNLKIVDTQLTTAHKTFTVTVSAYNCLSLDQLLEWALENYPHFEMHWFPAIFPKRSNSSLVPLEKRKQQVEKLKKLKPLCNNKTMKNIDKIILYLQKEDLKDQQIINEFVEYALLMDKVRNQNTLKTFPHLKSIFDRYKK